MTAVMKRIRRLEEGAGLSGLCFWFWTKAVRCTIDGGAEAKLEFWFESLRTLRRFIRRCSHLTVPARDRRYFRLDFIEKLRRVMSGQAV
jgi:hypothetical protein